MKTFILVFSLMMFPVVSNAAEYFAYYDNVLITNNVKSVEILPNSNVKFENERGEVFIVKKDIENLQFISYDNVKIKIFNDKFYRLNPTSFTWERIVGKNILK